MFLKLKLFALSMFVSLAAIGEQGVVVRPGDFLDDEEEAESGNVFARVIAGQITLKNGSDEEKSQVGDGQLHQSRRDKRQYFIADRGVHRVQVSSPERQLPAGDSGEVRELPDPDGTTLRALWQSNGRGRWVSLPTHEEYEQLKPAPPPPPAPPIRSRDPLILDLNGDKIKLVGPGEGPQFDVDGDGSPEFTGWPVGADDAFLAMDRDGNGLITNGNELFGMTPRNPGKANGFEILAELDENRDGVISKADASVWNKLILWVDSNTDGISQPGHEYSTLDSKGILEIVLKWKNDDQRHDIHHNLFKEYSTFSRMTKKGVVDRPIVNVWFQSFPVP